VLRPRPTAAHSRTQLASTSWPRLAWLDAACCRCPPQARPPFACLRLQHTPAAAVPYGEQETQSREARKLIRRPSSIRDTASGGKLVSACGQRMHEHMTARNSRCSNQNRWSLVRFDWNPAKSNSYWAGKRPPLLQILGLWLLYIAGADGCSLDFFCWIGPSLQLFPRILDKVKLLQLRLSSQVVKNSRHASKILSLLITS
jgi:hypothetical protein